MTEERKERRMMRKKRKKKILERNKEDGEREKEMKDDVRKDHGRKNIGSQGKYEGERRGNKYEARKT